MSEEIEKFIKRNYDNIRRAYEFDNIARKKVVENYKTDFSTHNEQATPTWEIVSANIRMEWENLKDMLDPLNATRNALLPVVEKRAEWLAEVDEERQTLNDIVEEVGFLMTNLQLDNTGKALASLTEAAAYIIVAIEKLNNSINESEKKGEKKW